MRYCPSCREPHVIVIRRNEIGGVDTTLCDRCYAERFGGNHCGEAICWPARRLERELREVQAAEEYTPLELLEVHARVWTSVYAVLFGSDQ